MTIRTRAPRSGALLLTLAATLSGCATIGETMGAAVGAVSRRGSSEAEAAKSAPMREIVDEPEEFLREAEGIYVVVDLEENMLSLMDGDDALWRAPVGTGTGLRLRGDDGEWHFTTPEGVFQIQYKEEMPIWLLPDWYYIEKDLPIPPQNAPERRAPNQLGIAAVYLGEEIAIHGTERPELLGQRVSHGCIRLANEYALRLFHNVQIGTPVVVVGGESIADEPPAESTDPGRSTPAETPDSLARYTTTELLAMVGTLLREGDRSGRWVAYTSRLITRGLKDDADALRGVLSVAGTAASETLDREYATFLADVYSRGTRRTVVSLARIGEAERERAARAIVEATMALHAGGAADPAAPWPTRRVPETRLGPAGQAGWAALLAAEEAYRNGRRLADREAGPG